MKEFFVVYDYGTGGVWGIATAESEHDILALFPELQVIPQKPDWMDDKVLPRTRQVSTFAIGDEATYPQWLRTLQASR